MKDSLKISAKRDKAHIDSKTDREWLVIFTETNQTESVSTIGIMETTTKEILAMDSGTEKGLLNTMMDQLLKENLGMTKNVG